MNHLLLEILFQEYATKKALGAEAEIVLLDVLPHITNITLMPSM